jgi:hypothetical protein
VVPVFAILAGPGGVVVAFTGNYLGIFSKDLKPNAATGIVRAFYSLGGLFLGGLSLLTSAFFSSALKFRGELSALLGPREEMPRKLWSAEQSLWLSFCR